jgi:glucose repression regulatory protein TUP1
LKEYPGYAVEKKTSSTVRSLCFNPDGRYLVVGDGKGSYEFCDIWEVASKRVLARFKLYAQSVDVSPDGHLLIAASFGSVCIWKMRDGSSKFLWTGTDANYTTAKFSPNGRYVAASMMNEFVRIWNVRSSQLVGKWNTQQKYIWSIASSPDGAELMSGSWGGTMKSWDVSSLQTINGRIDEKDILVPNKKLEFGGHSVSWSCFDNPLLTYLCIESREVDCYLA